VPFVQEIIQNAVLGYDASMNDFTKAVQRYVANVGISGSSLRNQGAPGVVKKARTFLSELNLESLNAIHPSKYTTWLDEETDALTQRLPVKAGRWGAARKAINIFMAHAALNRVLAAAFGLVKFGDVMETPLDSVAACELRLKPGGERLPPWPGVGRLTKEISQQYQTVASEVAMREGIPRACLDVILWRPVVAVTPKDGLSLRGSSND
jgi:hypothetical protein